MHPLDPAFFVLIILITPASLQCSIEKSSPENTLQLQKSPKKYLPIKQQIKRHCTKGPKGLLNPMVENVPANPTSNRVPAQFPRAVCPGLFEIAWLSSQAMSHTAVCASVFRIQSGWAFHIRVHKHQSMEKLLH
ncbi:iroquois-class homeodomain protein IRX-6 [Platysternon megacephalum]|uniref:Iroquois-class homeodomain protein IRX-6 n=1 Tax=Platysternon megacephalum TaxID=55544 RepID=A0A4D9EGD7_9SAUR|nr:iroquois-class homeodomain protein IRX-6 [Platysternon megacephalum]